MFSQLHVVIRSTAIFLPRVVWFPEGFARTMVSWMKRVGCLFIDVFFFNDMVAVCADEHMDVFPSFSLFAYFHQPTWDCSIWEWILSEIYSPSERLCYWRVSVVGFTHHSCTTAQSVTFTQGYCILYKSYFWSCNLIGWECWYLDSTGTFHCLCHFTSFRNQNYSLHLYAQIGYFRIGLSSKCIK